MKYSIKILLTNGIIHFTNYEDKKSALDAYELILKNIKEQKDIIETANIYDNSKTAVYTKHIVAISYKQETVSNSDN